jgi:hypothetical protein
VTYGTHQWGAEQVHPMLVLSRFDRASFSLLPEEGLPSIECLMEIALQGEKLVSGTRSRKQTMSLEKEIETARRKVNTDEYGMSIGEIVNMYEKHELVINPSFQRLFRWEDHQKSKFIESILLGIPIPPIFVFETDKGQWELIDGLQRLSTILEFMGLLLEPTTKTLLSPSSLSATSYLPSLNEAKWDDSARFPKTLQFTFRRARLNIQILCIRNSICSNA